MGEIFTIVELVLGARYVYNCSLQALTIACLCLQHNARARFLTAAQQRVKLGLK